MGPMGTKSGQGAHGAGGSILGQNIVVLVILVLSTVECEK